MAFVVDVHAQRIVGGHAMTSEHTDLFSTCLRMATWRRDHDGIPVERRLIVHSRAGSRHTSVKLTGHLAVEGFTASIGSVGDACDCEHGGVAAVGV